MATYPGGIVSLSNPAGTDSVSTVDHAQQHALANDEIEAIETELGVNAKGPYATSVANRFEIMAYKAQSVKCATVGNLAATYANGTAGVGATLTANPSITLPASTTLDNPGSISVGDRVLVKNQTTPAQNGIYVVTQVTAPYILTRHYDADTSAKLADCKVLVDLGVANGDTEWYQSSTSPTIGTTGIYFRRSQPIYGHGNPRSLWVPGGGWPTASQPIMETVPRQVLGTTLLMTATQTLVGGIVAPAGRTVTNISTVFGTTGASYTIKHFAIVRQSDRLVLAHTANNTPAPTANVVTNNALTATWTPIEDTPVWILISITASTFPSFYAFSGNAAINGVAPALAGTNGVASSSTVPTDGTTTITAVTTGVTSIPYLWLS